MAATKIGVSGARGSFSERAARTYIGQKNGSVGPVDYSYLISAERVLASLESNAVDIAVFPIENSNGGMVHEALQAMSRHNFNIEEIIEVNVHHQLLVRPGTLMKDIKVITSHIQALAQCRMHLKREHRDVAIEEYADTAKAAEDLANGTLSPATAVIASLEAGNINSLEILARDIEDQKFNVTLFVVATRRA